MRHADTMAVAILAALLAVLLVAACGPRQPTELERMQAQTRQMEQESDQLNRLVKSITIQRLRQQGYTIPPGVE